MKAFILSLVALAAITAIAAAALRFVPMSASDVLLGEAERAAVAVLSSRIASARMPGPRTNGRDAAAQRWVRLSLRTRRMTTVGDSP